MPFLHLGDGGFSAWLESVGQATLATVLAVLVEGHENTGTTLSSGTFTAKTLDLAIRVDLVVLEDRHLDLLALVLDLFGSIVGLLLALLGTTTEAEH